MFGYAALKLALEESGVDYELQINPSKVTNERIRSMMREKIINIADFGTNPEFEKEWRSIYFPIDLGLNGWRIFLIHKYDRARFSKVKTLKDLQGLLAGQRPRLGG